MVPILAGLALGAAMGGGIAALQGKDILKGALMGGVGGALGGALAPAASGLSAGAEGVAAASSATNPLAGDIPGLFTNTAGGAASGAAGGGGSGLFSGGLGNFIGANKYALAGGALGGMMAENKQQATPSQGNIYTTQFSQEQNPLFGQPGQAYFKNQQYAPGTYTKVEDYNPTATAATGGLVALAEGGQTDRYTRPIRTVDPAVTAYNQQLMELANQQYNVNPRPAPNQVPGSAGYIAPPQAQAPAAAAPAASSSVSGLRFNPVTQQYEGDFSAPGDKKRSFFGGDIDYDELDARYMRNEGGFDSGGNGGGAANGGLMRAYAGGGLSALGGYSDGGQLLRGPGDGVSDDIPAQIGGRQPARLADGEFVVPARIVSELGNGSTDAGAKRLYAMMDRIQNNRKKTVGKGKVAVDSKAHKMLPA